MINKKLICVILLISFIVGFTIGVNANKPYFEMIVEVTAYTAGYESTGKRPTHPAYGITASGAKAKPGMIAAPKEFPFGTDIYIPGYGMSMVTDRGGLIKWYPEKQKYVLDVFIPNLRQALNWGRKTTVVRVYKFNLTEEQIDRIKRIKED